MDLGIAGRKAIVCASSRGLGRACAEKLAEAGCDVVINGRDAARLEATAAAVLGVYLHGLAADRLLPAMGDAGMIATDLLRELPAARYHLLNQGVKRC